MELQAKIGQFIPWEERKDYFFGFDWGDTPKDLLHVDQVKEYRRKWYGTFVLAIFLTKLGLIKNEGEEPYENIVFTHSLPILVERPHTYKLGDVITINISVSPGG